MNWINKHEPKNFDDIILHPKVRKRLHNVLTRPQSVILSGPPGIGKGTFSNFYFLANPNYDKLWINASMDGLIDKIRKTVKPFCNAAAGPLLGFSRFKIVVFNEADSLTPPAQAALKELIEEAEKVYTFFNFMVNNITKIDNAIQSRCSIINYYKPPITDTLTHMIKILHSEGASYDLKQVSKLVHMYHPDIRKTINELQLEFDK